MCTPVLLPKLPRTNSLNSSLRQRLVPWVCSFFLIVSLSPAVFAQGKLVRLAGETGGAEPSSRAIAQEWAQKTGNKVEFISRPQDATAALQQAQQYWAAKSPDIDIYMVDVIWQGICGPHAADLKKYFSEADIAEFFPRIIENNTVGGKLVSLPVVWRCGHTLLSHRSSRKIWLQGAAKNMGRAHRDGEEDSGGRTRGG